MACDGFLLNFEAIRKTELWMVVSSSHSGRPLHHCATGGAGKRDPAVPELREPRPLMVVRDDNMEGEIPYKETP